METLLKMPNEACVLRRRQRLVYCMTGSESPSPFSVPSIRLQNAGWSQAGLEAGTTLGSGSGQNPSIVTASGVDWNAGMARQAKKAGEEVGSDSAGGRHRCTQEPLRRAACTRRDGDRQKFQAN